MLTSPYCKLNLELFEIIAILGNKHDLELQKSLCRSLIIQILRLTFDEQNEINNMIKF
jgi:hypothetical protein